MIKLKNVMKQLNSVLEDNNIGMDIVCQGGRAKKKLMKVPSTGHLRYDWFKQNLKSNTFIHSILKTLFDNVDRNISSSLINLCHYIAECCEDEFI